MNLSIVNIFGFTQSWGSVIHRKNPLDLMSFQYEKLLHIQ